MIEERKYYCSCISSLHTHVNMQIIASDKQAADMSILKIKLQLKGPVGRRIAHLHLNPDSTIEASSGISPK